MPESIISVIKRPSRLFLPEMGELNQGRLKLSKFKAKKGWVLCCVTYGHFQVDTPSFECVREKTNRGGWHFTKCWRISFSKPEYISWYSHKIATSFNPAQAKSTSFTDKVKSDGNLTHDEKKKKRVPIKLIIRL